MKKGRIRIIVGILFVIVIWGMGSRQASAAQETAGVVDEDLLSEIPLSEIDEALKAGQDTGDISFSDIFRQLSESDREVDKKEWTMKLLRLAFEDLSECKSIFIQILLVTAAFAFLHNFINVFENSQISKTGFYLYFLVLMVLLMRSYLLIHDLLDRILGQAVEFMDALLPAFCMAMVFSSQQATAAAFYQLSLIVIYLVERILLYLIVPGIHIYVVLQMLNFMTDGRLISRMTTLLKSMITWGMRALLAGVTGMNIIENMIAPSVDNLKKMSVTKTISMIPGLGNTAEAVGNIFLGSAVVIKNGIGAAALVVLLCICIGPFVKMLIFTFLYKAAGAVVQPFADKRICGCIDSVGEGASLLLRALVTGMLLFMITVAVVVTATG